MSALDDYLASIGEAPLPQPKPVPETRKQAARRISSDLSADPNKPRSALDEYLAYLDEETAAKNPKSWQAKAKAAQDKLLGGPVAADSPALMPARGRSQDLPTIQVQDRRQTGAGDAFTGGMASGSTAGFLDEMAGLAAAGGPASKGYADKLGVYRSERDQVRKQQQELRDEHPRAYLGGEMAGATASTASTALPGLRALNVAKGAGYGATAAKMAGQGAINALGNSEADLTRGEAGRAALDTAAGAAIGAGLGTAGKFAGEKVGNWLAKAPAREEAKAVQKAVDYVPQTERNATLAKLADRAAAEGVITEGDTTKVGIGKEVLQKILKDEGLDQFAKKSGRHLSEEYAARVKASGEELGDFYKMLGRSVAKTTPRATAPVAESEGVPSTALARRGETSISRYGSEAAMPEYREFNLGPGARELPPVEGSANPRIYRRSEKFAEKATAPGKAGSSAWQRDAIPTERPAVSAETVAAEQPTTRAEKAWMDAEYTVQSAARAEEGREGVTVAVGDVRKRLMAARNEHARGTHERKMLDGVIASLDEDFDGLDRVNLDTALGNKQSWGKAGYGTTNAQSLSPATSKQLNRQVERAWGTAIDDSVKETLAAHPELGTYDKYAALKSRYAKLQTIKPVIKAIEKHDESGTASWHDKFKGIKENYETVLKTLGVLGVTGGAHVGGMSPEHAFEMGVAAYGAMGGAKQAAQKFALILDAAKRGATADKLRSIAEAAGIPKDIAPRIIASAQRTAAGYAGPAMGSDFAGARE